MDLGTPTALLDYICNTESLSDQELSSSVELLLGKAVEAPEETTAAAPSATATSSSLETPPSCDRQYSQK